MKALTKTILYVALFALTISILDSTLSQDENNPKVLACKSCKGKK